MFRDNVSGMEDLHPHQVSMAQALGQWHFLRVCRAPRGSWIQYELDDSSDKVHVVLFLPGHLEELSLLVIRTQDTLDSRNESPLIFTWSLSGSQITVA